ncbi:hypothetical protein [Salinibacter ruber]|uniref:hypothetical protein n=1 Tax=Salinibacter ruber TaxID=146919 RepID=UPI0019677C5C|nr:hypothetical protein [Salinibacter ruber]
MALSLSHHTFSANLDRAGSRRYLFILLAIVLLGLPFSSTAQTTQTLSLDAGWNLVSLRVQPDDSSFAAIFDGSVSMAKNANGKVYLPSEGIEQILMWRTGEGYQVYAETATTLDVSGAEAPIGSTLVELDEGWNVVPYLPAKARAAEKAMVSIEGSLVVVEDEDGRQYDPSASSSPLDSLRPGQGYKVYVDQADTLRYPRVTQTLNNALSLQGMPTGSYVRVRGRDEPEDGGGGVFQVTESGCETDGGTCFVFDEDQSSEVQRTPGTTKPNFPETDLIWGTVSAKVGPDDGEVVEDKQMHISKGKNTDDWINHKQGWIGQNDAQGLYQVRSNFTGGSSYDPVYTYKHATSDRRLERIGVTNAVNIDWWGAKEADPNNPVDNTPYIGWAIKKAAEIYQNSSYDRVYVDIPGDYYWHHTIRLRNGVWLRGAGAERSVPSESWTTKGKLITTPGKAIYTHALSYDVGAENDVYAALGRATQAMSNEYLVEKAGLENLEVDGNYQNNKHPWNSNDYDLSDDKGTNILQNGSIWSAFGTTDSGGKEWAQGGTLHLNNVYVHDTGSNGIGAAGKMITTGKNVRLTNSVRNHPGYGLGGGTIENLTIGGYAWEVHMKFGKKNNEASNYPGQKFEDWADNPEKDADSFHLSSNIGKNVTVSDFLWDFSDATGGDHIIRTGQTGGTYENGTIRTRPQGRTSLIFMPGYRAIDVPLQTTVKDFTAYNEGSGGLRLIRKSQRQVNVIVENATVQAASGADATTSVAPLGYTVSPKYEDKVGVPGRNVVRNIDYQHQIENIVDFGGNASNYDAFPRELFVESSSFDNTGPDLHVDGGRLGLDRDESLRTARVYFDDVTFNVPDAINNVRNFHGLIGGNIGDVFRIRNCQDRNGRTSDAVNESYTSGAGQEGQSYVDIPTSLMSFPEERNATVTNGSPNVSSVSSIEVVDSDGNTKTDPFWQTGDAKQKDPYLRVNLDGTIGSEETVTIEWTARVTPLDSYTTTGLFISRPVRSKSYTSGNGPFTVDLRGVAVSQESRDPVVYTASSGDASVVTVNVQNDDYTLELTEQGTGTATITVTGEIPGVGTTSTTFEVSVE